MLHFFLISFSVNSATVEDFPMKDGWKKTLPKQDQRWISNALFKWSFKGKDKKKVAELDETKLDRMWFYPPKPVLIPSHPPKFDRYFASRLFLWMPRRMLRVSLICPNEGCDANLTSGGLYQRVRRVFDIDDTYLLATENLECSRLVIIKKLLGFV